MVCAAAEAAAGAKDFAALGLELFAQDQSGIDVAQIPGLARTAIDAHGTWLAGPTWDGGADRRAVTIHRCFYLPAPASQVVVVIRSWRNTHTFRIGDPVIRPAAPGETPGETWVGGEGIGRVGGRLTRDGRIALGPEPLWYRHGLVPGRGLTFKGQVIAQGHTEGALAQVVFRDALGKPLPTPYPETLATLAIPAFLDIPVHREAYRFTLKVLPPPQAATLEIGFAAWEANASLALTGAPDVLLDDDLRLANLVDDADPAAETVLALLLGRIGGAVARDGATAAGSIRSYLDPARLAQAPAPLRSFLELRDGPDASRWAEGALRLGRYPAWTLPEAVDWAADPFRSPAWRLAFQSLSWTGATARSPDRRVRDRAVAVAVSWSRANPWGRPADTLSLHPACMAMRLEALLSLLGAAARDAAGTEAHAVEILGGEIVRHAFALAEILAQHTVAGSLLEVKVATALLAAGLALPSLPMARHWTCLAAIALRSGFEALIDAGGVIAEPSYHRSLEILTLALILLPVLGARADLASFAGSLDLRLAKAWTGLVALFEPDDTLPPFGDTPGHDDRAGWIERVAASHPRPWMARSAADRVERGDEPVSVEPARSGAIVYRRWADGPDWASFTADFSEQVHPQDHRDCTSFTFATGGLRWITEVGESHTESPGQHLAAARAHNVVVPDGREPTAGTGVARAPFTLGAASVHLIDTSVHGPDYRHVRAFAILDDLSGLAVFDRFATGGAPLSLEGFLHLDPAVAVALDAAGRVFALWNDRRLQIVPQVIAGQLGRLAVGRAWSGPEATVPGAVPSPKRTPQPEPVLSYGLSGGRSVAGGLLIAASSESLMRLAQVVEDGTFRRALTD
ncbi:heparinase II/III family protein [Methylobacterium sp. E-066]|uniref:heparinase II/III family protein n=1 Tax=Methylobacterium sp. E-066 TaxID=2836584 RepID=UPI001FBB9EC7|nr:heparinase II/III family protein [Methylobacterium sp. E-066]MCJ2140897.1 heparinase II/III family protein [Methylobacterium sp. E-066]